MQNATKSRIVSNLNGILETVTPTPEDYVV